MTKFVAIFHTKDGIEIKRVKVDYKALKEKDNSPKPENIFRWRKGSYLYDPTKKVAYTRKLEPIFRYIEGQTVPVVDVVKESNTATDNDAFMFDTVITRGEIRNNILGMMKATPKIDWMQVLLYIGMGIAIGYIIHGFVPA